jgi:molybdenum cofactor synthesis domain-containing protein
MNAEIINIGDELLLGQTIDTNSVYIAKRLNEFGINISRKYCISDNENEILECLENSMARTDLVIITGGLGPTKDDITKSTLAKFFKSDWRIDQDVLNHLEVIFKNRHRELLEINKLQANLPSNSTTLFNKAGTAPGMMFQMEDKIVISLPGVPNEVEEIIENSFIPFIKTKYNIPQQKRRTLITLLEPESKLSQLLNDFETKYSKTYPLSYLPSYNMVKIRLNQNLIHSNGDEFEEESLEDNEVIDEEEIEEIEANEAEAAALAEEQQANTNHPSTNLPPKQVWRPGIDKLPEGEELEYDPSAYIMYHAMRTEWPCLSFDILRDIYGDNRLRVSNIAFSDK